MITFAANSNSSGIPTLLFSGTIDSINDDTIQLEIANKTNITLSKKSIAMKKVLKEELKIDDLKKDDTVKDDADLKENK